MVLLTSWLNLQNGIMLVMFGKMIFPCFWTPFLILHWANTFLVLALFRVFVVSVSGCFSACCFLLLLNEMLFSLKKKKKKYHTISDHSFFRGKNVKYTTIFKSTTTCFLFYFLNENIHCFTPTNTYSAKKPPLSLPNRSWNVSPVAVRSQQ